MGRAVLDAALVACGLVAGCGGSAKLELAAGDALLAVADEMEVTVAEYHDDVSRLDDARESAAISAFVARVQADAGDSAAVDAHATAFEELYQPLKILEIQQDT